MISVVQIVNTVFQSNTWILYLKDYEHVWLIDCGDFEPVTDWLNREQKTIKGIFLTHTHFDHIYGLGKMEEVFTDVRIYTSTEGKNGLADIKLNFSIFHGQHIVFKSTNIEIITESTRIELFPEIELKTWATPGHDWSCLTYCAGNYLFTGDSYIPGLKVVTTFPKSNKTAAAASLIKIKSLISKDTIICPGHGKMQLEHE
jgi:glyoxylase-like metal-dependent hydrolase (beta-lactamase superfamily II)